MTLTFLNSKTLGYALLQLVFWVLFTFKNLVYLHYVSLAATEKLADGPPVFLFFCAIEKIKICFFDFNAPSNCMWLIVNTG